jgi:hypothetical protein
MHRSIKRYDQLLDNMVRPPGGKTREDINHPDGAKAAANDGDIPADCSGPPVKESEEIDILQIPAATMRLAMLEYIVTPALAERIIETYKASFFDSLKAFFNTFSFLSRSLTKRSHKAACLDFIAASASATYIATQSHRQRLQLSQNSTAICNVLLFASHNSDSTPTISLSMHSPWKELELQMVKPNDTGFHCPAGDFRQVQGHYSFLNLTK